jgi:hypothetical protein
MFNEDTEAPLLPFTDGRTNAFSSTLFSCPVASGSKVIRARGISRKIGVSMGAPFYGATDVRLGSSS